MYFVYRLQFTFRANARLDFYRLSELSEVRGDKGAAWFDKHEKTPETYAGAFKEKEDALSCARAILGTRWGIYRIEKPAGINNGEDCEYIAQGVMVEDGDAQKIIFEAYDGGVCGGIVPVMRTVDYWDALRMGCYIELNDANEYAQAVYSYCGGLGGVATVTAQTGSTFTEYTGDMNRERFVGIVKTALEWGWDVLTV